MNKRDTPSWIWNAKAGPYTDDAAPGFGFEKETDEPGDGAYRVRFPLGKKRPTMGLGRIRHTRYADALREAQEAVRLGREGINPIDERKRKKAANLAAERAKMPVVFEDMLASYIKTRKWRRRNAAANWLSPIRLYALPVLKGLSLAEITIAHSVAIIDRAETVSKDQAARGVQPRTETARRLVSRVEAVLDAHIALSGVAIRNPFDRKLVEKIRPLRRQGARPNYRRIAVDTAQSTHQELCQAQERATGHKASALAVWLAMALCALRPSEMLLLRWSRIDFGKRLLTLLPEDTKSLREHIVPLSDAAVALFERQLALRTGSDFVFTGISGGRIGYANFARAPAEAGIDAGAAHSWRSIFRDWCGDIGRVDRDLAESALAHSLGAAERG